MSSKKQIEILFEDDHLIIFNKPANLLVIPTENNKNNTLVNIVNEQYSKPSEHKLHPCHRLDRETSGIIIFAKGKKNQQAMMDVFKKKLIKKNYVAFVHGTFKNTEGKINSPVLPFGVKKYSKGANPKDALTHYKILETRRDFSVISVQLLTGRTNQIRIHFQSIKHPLVGDRKYSFARDYKLKFKRAALHASDVSFDHPITKKKINISLKLPKDMEAFSGNN